MEKTPLYYYDFYVGVPNSHPKEWKYQPLKIAAHNEEMAIYSKLLLHIGFQPVRTRIFNLKGHDNNLLYQASLSVRMVVKFELANLSGKTKYRFKKVAEYTSDRILKK